MLAFRELLTVRFCSFSPGLTSPTPSILRASGRKISLSSNMAGGLRKTPPRAPPSVSSPSPAVVSADSVLRRCDDICKSSGDKRLYRGLELENRMKVLLVCDPDADKAAASIDVNVGHMSDPDHLPGLAHFLEHMLFMGTEKYPKENEYNKFLSENGGMFNASTSSDHTTYYFDVLPQHLPTALDIFAQFFIAPLFNEDATDRELRAVDSEHDKNRADDNRRFLQLHKSLADPSHPYRKFGTGRRESLEISKSEGGNLRSELLKFHDTWYSSNNMSLIVLGKNSPDELESLVVPLFAALKDKNAIVPSWPEHPYPPELRRKQAFVVPIMDMRSLIIDFPIPDLTEHYKSVPEHYPLHLLGHKGPGSLFSALKSRGWCNSLEGGATLVARGFGFFRISLSLTEDGVNHVDDIVELFFQYISLMNSSEPHKWIWEEQRHLLLTHFNFTDVQKPLSFVSAHVHSLQDYPVEDILCLNRIVTDWRPDLIKDLLSMLTPDNVRVSVVAKSHEEICTETEPWYGTKYHVEDIAEDVLQRWRSAEPIPELHLPLPNEFIPESLSLVPRLDKKSSSDFVQPAIVRDTPLLRLWFKQDEEFNLPKATTKFCFISPLACADPTSCTLTSLWVDLLADSLTELLYATGLAGLHKSVQIGPKYELTLTIEGYDNKQHVLLEKVVQRMVNFKVDPKRFEIIKEDYIHLKNFEAEQPNQLASYHLEELLTEDPWTRQEKQDAAKDVTEDMINDFAACVFRNLHVEGLIFGNLTEERALDFATIVEQSLPKDGRPLLAQQLQLNREVQLEKGSHYLFEVENSIHKSSCVSLYYQCGILETKDECVLALLQQIIEEPFFNVLRTKEQLGYIVNSGVYITGGAQGLRLVVQSAKHPSHVEERMEAFLEYMRQYLCDLSPEEFLRRRSTLVARSMEKPKSLSVRTDRIWAEIVSHQYNFDQARLAVKTFETITKEDLIDHFAQFVCASSESRQKLSVHVLSMAEGGAGKAGAEPCCQDALTKAVRISDVVEWKAGRPLFPLITPFLQLPKKGALCKL